MERNSFSKYEKNKITKLCYEFFSPSWVMKINNPPSLLMCIQSFLHRVLYYIWHVDMKEPCIKELIFFSTSVNNNNALKPIWEKIPEEDRVIWGSDFIFSETKISIYSFLFFFSFLKIYGGLSKKEKLVAREYNYWFINILGYYKVIGNLLKRNKNKIKLVIMANDHSPVNQCIIENCIKYGIKTLYIQHASVNDEFPPNRFSYSFLDGLDSCRKYLSIREFTGKAFLSGSTRFDTLKNQVYLSKYVGIAINTMDDFDKIFSLCRYLVEHDINNIIMRPHPRLELKIYEIEKIRNLGIELSDSKTENPFSFIAKLKLLISNESSIHLEALLMHVPSVQFNFSTLPFLDHYSFVKKGITPFYENYEDVEKECMAPHVVSLGMIKEWNAAYGTKYDGKVSDVIYNFIKNLKNGTEKDYIDSIFKFNTKGYYEYKENFERV